jgi:hypothetical protein
MSNRRRSSGPHRERRPAYACPLDPGHFRVAEHRRWQRRSGAGNIGLMLHDREAIKWAMDADEMIEAGVWAAEENP